MLNMQPFMRPSPHTEQGQFYDQGLMDKAAQEEAAAKEKIRQEDLIRQQQRDIGMPMDFMAAGGGIATLEIDEEFEKAQKEMEKLMKEYKNKDLDWDAVKRSYRIWTK